MNSIEHNICANIRIYFANIRIASSGNAPISLRYDVIHIEIDLNVLL